MFRVSGIALWGRDELWVGVQGFGLAPRFKVSCLRILVLGLLKFRGRMRSSCIS